MILAVGEDFDLLKTRADVLRKTGANVLCSSGAAAVKFITEWEFDLIVLGHSVRQQDVLRITEAAHREGAKTLVLLLVANRLLEQEYDGIKLDGRSVVEPDCLIRSALDLLGRQGSRPPEETPSEKLIFSPFARKKPASHPADIEARRRLIAHFESHKAG